MEAFSRFRTHKSALLLARLLLHPHRSHARDELADWLWPDVPADRGRANLSQTLLRLRRQFAAPPAATAVTTLFVADHQHIRVCAAAFQTDTACFERRIRDAHAQTTQAARSLSSREEFALWDAALQAYGGDLLPGFYDDWIERERQRLSEMHQSAQSCRESARAAIHAAGNNAGDRAPMPSRPAENVPAPLMTSLPLTLTRFFGRDTELAHIHALLAQTPSVRLITLVGMGGIGKTRLAIETVRAHSQGQAPNDTAPFGFVAFLPLADATDAAHIGSALLHGLLDADNVRKAGDAPLPVVVRFLNEAARRQTSGRVLLVLDNLEQLGAACAPIVAQILREVPTLTVLATSRQPIGVIGEQEIAVGPLSATVRDDDWETPSPDIRLFTDRARLVRPDFRLSAQNEAAVRNLCALLEGVPLALELAAAWARVLGPIEIAARLRNRFDLLALRGASVSGAIPKRHQSLRAALAWSYDLLPPSLQSFFAQLSAFRGGWTADAAQSVTNIKEVSEPLLLLAERSLILAESDETTGALRYRMLESLREFAEEHSQQGSAAAHSALCLRHARYFEEHSRNGGQTIEAGRADRHAQTLLGPERDNIRAALRFTLQPTAETGEEDAAARFSTGIRLALQSLWLWSPDERAQYLSECAVVVDSLPSEVSQPLRARILAHEGQLALSLGDYETARQKTGKSLKIWEALEDRGESLTVKKRLGGIAMRAGDSAQAIDLWLECLDSVQGGDEPLREAGLLNNLAACDSNRPERHDWVARSIVLYRLYAPDSHSLAMALNTKGGIALEEKDFDTARSCLEEAHTIAVADGAVGMMSVAKATLGQLFVVTHEQPERAERLLTEAQELFEKEGESGGTLVVLTLCFQLALHRGDADSALCQAREYRRIATLREGIAVVETHVEHIKALRDAGFTQHAAQLEQSL